MSVKQQYQELLATHIIERLQEKNIEGFYCETKAEGLDKALSILPFGCTVSCGGSESLQEIGFREGIAKRECEFLDPLSVSGASSMDAIAHKALAVDYFFMGTNAITMEGELVNVDGYGNRVAALIFGPEHVVVFAGMNKVEPDTSAAVKRLQTVAAPCIFLKFSPSVTTFADLMQKAETGMGQIVVTKNSAVKGRISVILVGEPLGF
jgi:hypothetical protein